MIPVMQQMLWHMVTLVSAPAFWLMAGVVYLQIRRRAIRKSEMFQVQREPVFGLTVFMISAGMAGGMLASFLLLFAGVSLEGIGLERIWIMALLLMLIRQRFFCFAYAGGILAACCCLTGWPQISVSHLLMLVAILHCTEAFLIWFTGSRNAMPVYLREKDGTVTGGFLLQMTWPLPLVMLFAMGSSVHPQAGFFLFPEWWPIIGLESGNTGYNLYIMLPVLAALGYSDSTTNLSVRRKTARSAGLLMAYSLCLMALVFITDGHGIWQLVPALFAPLGHEAVIKSGRKQRLKHSSYQAPAYGVQILDVQKYSPAYRAGLRRGDWIIRVNDEAVKNREQFLDRWTMPLCDMTVHYRRGEKEKTGRICMGKTLHTGIITVPDENSSIFWTLQEDRGIAKFLYKKCEKTLKNVR